MIKLTKYRFFHNGTKGFIEEIEYLMAGVIGQGYIPLTDPRIVSIGEFVADPNTGEVRDKWLISAINNPAFDSTVLHPTCSYETVREFDPITRKLVDVNIQLEITSYPIIQNPYLYPLKPGAVEVTESEYNAIVDAEGPIEELGLSQEELTEWPGKQKQQ